MYKYTLGFVKKNDQLLMLNREKAYWMGNWNGIGGRLESGEDAIECMIRETYEETGLNVSASEVHAKGTVIWDNGDGTVGGMYLFLIEMPCAQELVTPVKVDEGILDWKNIDWILNKENLGVVPNIQFFLPHVLNSDDEYEHELVYNNDELVKVRSKMLEDVDIAE